MTSLTEGAEWEWSIGTAAVVTAGDVVFVTGATEVVLFISKPELLTSDMLVSVHSGLGDRFLSTHIRSLFSKQDFNWK